MQIGSQKFTQSKIKILSALQHLQVHGERTLAIRQISPIKHLKSQYLAKVPQSKCCAIASYHILSPWLHEFIQVQ